MINVRKIQTISKEGNTIHKIEERSFNELPNGMFNPMDEFKRMSKQMDELSRALVLNPFNEDFFDVFTKKRMELVRAIMNHEPQSIRELANEVERDVKNVFDDLKILQNVNIINFQDCGNCKKPVVAKKTIIFNLTNGEQHE